MVKLLAALVPLDVSRWGAMTTTAAASLIPADNVALLLGLFAGAALWAVTAEKKGPLKGMPGPALIFFAAALATQVQILPRESPFYDTIWRVMVPLAIAMFLLKADIVEIVQKGGRTLLGFAFGSVGVVVGAFIAAATLNAGPEEAKLAAVFTATYIGGSMNFAAVAEAVQFQDRGLLASALAIDNLLGVSCIVFLMYMASWKFLQKRFHWRADEIFHTPTTAELAGDRVMTVSDLFAIVGIAAVACAAASAIMNAVGYPSYSMLAITVIMTMVGTFGKKYVAGIKGEDVLAMGLMYMFIAMVGTGIDFQAMFSAAPGLFLMVLIIFVTHFVFMFAAAYFFKLNYAEIIVASLACITGPPVVAAVAIAFKWNNLLAPGVLTGVLGYIIGNFIGIGVFWALT
jgi:uncharacterized membrane protein